MDDDNVYRKVDVSQYVENNYKPPKEYQKIFTGMNVGDAWDVPPGTNLRSISANCAFVRKEFKLNVVLRQDRPHSSWIVVRLPDA